jgi:hypothetical protein
MNSDCDQRKQPVCQYTSLCALRRSLTGDDPWIPQLLQCQPDLVEEALRWESRDREPVFALYLRRIRQQESDERGDSIERHEHEVAVVSGRESFCVNPRHVRLTHVLGRNPPGELKSMLSPKLIPPPMQVASWNIDCHRAK